MHGDPADRCCNANPRLHSTTVFAPFVGWVIVVAFGALFTLLTSVMVFLDYRFGGANHTSEQFSTAGAIRAVAAAEALLAM